MIRQPSVTAALVAVLTLALAAGCTSAPVHRRAGVVSSTPSATAVSPAPTSTSTRSTAVLPVPPDVELRLARRALASMSAGQRVAQLLMTATPSQAASPTLLSMIRSGDIGSAILTGVSHRGAAATRSVVSALQSAVDRGQPRLFVCTDQEGGLVQDLRGPGFDTIPSGLAQGQLPPPTLRTEAERWGAQLRSAGLNVTLGPVLDTVPDATFAARNPPIGQLDREFGFDPAVVSAHGLAVVQGMAAAGVDVAVKHFPGLGRVLANTDYRSGVIDRQTTATDVNLAPFRVAIEAGAPFVMVSTAIYTRIDASAPAAFSARVVSTLLRGTLGFHGVVISDDLGAARQVASVPVGQRAVRFVRAGGDVVLTVDPAQIPAMRQALLAEMRAPSFARLVDAAALRVLLAKARAGQLS